MVQRGDGELSFKDMLFRRISFLRAAVYSRITQHQVVVFLCARTLRRAKYRLTFKVPKTSVAKMQKFWADYGPVIKVAGALTVAVVKASTGISLGDLVPTELASSLSTAKEVRCGPCQ